MPRCRQVLQVARRRPFPLSQPSQHGCIAQPAPRRRGSAAVLMTMPMLMLNRALYPAQPAAALIGGDSSLASPLPRRWCRHLADQSWRQCQRVPEHCEMLSVRTVLVSHLPVPSAVADSFRQPSQRIGQLTAECIGHAAGCFVVAAKFAPSTTRSSACQHGSCGSPWRGLPAGEAGEAVGTVCQQCA